MKLFKISIKSLALGQVQQVDQSFQSDHQYCGVVHRGQSSGGRTDDTRYDDVVDLYHRTANAPISQFIGFAQSLQDALISLERLNEVHAKEDEEQTILSKSRTLPERRDLEVENLSFSYDGAERDHVLEEINLTIPQRKVTAIVGASGSGKTTLVKPLLWLLPPDQRRDCGGRSTIA